MIEFRSYGENKFAVEGPFTEISALRSRVNNQYPAAELQGIQEGFTVDSEALVSFLANVMDHDFEFNLPERLNHLVEIRRLEVTAIAEFRSPIDNLEGIGIWADILMPHQAEAVAQLVIDNLPGAALFDEQGVGKTLTALAAFDILFKKKAINRAIVVSPSGGFPAWRTDVDKFLPANYRFAQVEGRKDSALISVSNQILLTSFDSVKALLPDLRLYASAGRTLLIIDESFFAKNSEAQRTRALAQLRKEVARCFVLCGTPTPQSPLDLVSQMNLADRGITFQGFLPSGDSVEDFHQIEMRASYAPIIRRTKEEVLPDLPGKQFSIIEADLKPHQLALYEQILSELVLYLRTVDRTMFEREVQTYLQKRMALTQVSISPSLLGQPDTDSGKYEMVSELLQKHFEQSARSVIIWCSFTTAINDLKAKLEKYSPLVLDGRVHSAEEKYQIVQAFQEAREHRVLIANPKSASTSLTLTAANRSIYLDIPWQAAYLMQSIDRIHRTGQTSAEVFIDFIISKNTVDIKDYERAKLKIDSQAKLLGDPSPPLLSYDEAVAELGLADRG